MANEQNTGWVRLYRSMLGWEWFDDPLTLQLWIVCLLKANHAPTRWQGIDIERGSFVSSVEKLCAATGQSPRQIRTRLSNLQTSCAISIKATNRYSIITICNYDIYQPAEIASDEQIDNQATNCFRPFPELSARTGSKIDERSDELKNALKGNNSMTYKGGNTPDDEPTDNQTTIKRQTNDKRPTTNNNNKELKNNKESLSFACAHATEAERERFFEIFFFRNFQKPEYEVERFCANYEASGWIRKNGQPVVDRLALARTWTQEDKNAAPRFDADFMQRYKELYALAKRQNPAAAVVLIRDLQGVAVGADRIDLACSARFMEIVERNADFFRSNFFTKHYAGRAVHYRVPRQ